MKATIFFSAAFALLIGFAVWDDAGKTCGLARDFTFTGHAVVVERCRTRIGIVTGDSRIVAYLN